MSGNQLVYGDGWDDVKDCVGGGLGGLFGGSDRRSSGYQRERSCTKMQIVVALLSIWILILTIVTIILGSKIAHSSGATLSERLDAHSADHATKHSTHSRILTDLGSSHERLQGHVSGVSDQLGRLDGDVERMEGRLRSEVKGKLVRVRETLMNALDKVGQSIQEIKDDVRGGMV